MKTQFALLVLLAIISMVQGNNEIPGLWTGYRVITNDGTSLSYNEVINFTDTELVQPQDYQTMCTFHNLPVGVDITNFDCICLKLTSAVDCTVQIGSANGWTSVTLMIGATSRDDIRMGHFTRVYMAPFSSSTINEYLAYPWAGTPNQADMWADVYLSGVSSSDTHFSIDINNAGYDVSTNQIQFDLNIANHDNTNLQLTYSFVIYEVNDELDIEIDLDTNTVEPNADEINGIVNF